MIKSSIVRIVILSYTLALFFGAPASAGIDVGGAICVQEVNPGQHVTHKMTVLTDKDSSPMDMEAKVWGWTQGLNDELVLIDPAEDRSPFSAAPFLRVSPERFHVEPGILQEVVLEGDVPQDAGPGTLLAVVQIKTVPVGNGTISVSSGVDVPIKLILKNGNLTKTGEISDFEATGPESSKDREIGISFILKNTGNANYYPIVKASLRDELGNILANKSTESSNTLLPTFARQFRITLATDEELKPGTYYANATVGLENGVLLDGEEAEIKIRS